MSVKCTCLYCNKIFERSPRGIKRGEGKYCSRKCMSKARERGGNRLMMGDYIRIYLPGGKTAAEHRLVVEQQIGRPLLPSEKVHHIDGDKLNNSTENLMIVSDKEHAEIHLSLKENQWSLDYERCVECGTIKRPHMARGLCDRCYRRKASRHWRHNHAHK